MYLKKIVKYLFDGTVLHKKNYFSQHCWYGFLSGFSLRQWAAVSTAYGVSSVPSKISKNVIRYLYGGLAFTIKYFLVRPDVVAHWFLAHQTSEATLFTDIDICP